MSDYLTEESLLMVHGIVREKCILFNTKEKKRKIRKNKYFLNNVICKCVLL